MDRTSLRVTGMYSPELKGYLFQDCGMVDLGDLGDAVILAQSGKEGCLQSVAHMVRLVSARGTIPFLIGGDHSVTAGAVAGLSTVARLGVIHIDAHSDYPGPSSRDLSFENIWHSNFVQYASYSM